MATDVTKPDDTTATSIPGLELRGDSQRRGGRDGATSVFGIGRSMPSSAGETHELLRDRIRVVSAIIAVGLALFLARDLFVPEAAYLLWARLLLVVAYGAIALRLRNEASLTIHQLRRLEIGMLGMLSVWFAADRFYYIHNRAVAGDVIGVLFTLDFAVLVYVAFITAYAVFIPNTWQRALRVTIPLALLPFGLVGLAYWLHPQDVLVLQEGFTLARLTSLGLMLVLALMFAAGGARLIHALREEVLEARQLGQYRLIEKVGAGGIGEVWRAEHRLLPRPAAIKLIRPEILHASSALEADSVLRRFEREVRATSILRSPHTVEIYDFGITHDQVFYYVMELLEGHDLKRMVDRFGPLPEARVIYLLCQVCESLAEAHEQGFVHRDIKPANIYACRLGNCFDYIKVLDFGLVAAVDPGVQETALGEGTAAAGTPAFMAPEAIRRDTFIDFRADLYALGCVAYWLLTGELVFAGNSSSDVARAHLTAEPMAPSRRVGRSLDATVEEVVLACLSKDPSQRPDSANDLAAALSASSAAGGWGNIQARAWWQEELAV